MRGEHVDDLGVVFLLQTVESLVDYGAVAPHQEGDVHSGGGDKGLLEIIPVGKDNSGCGWGEFVVGGDFEGVFGIVYEGSGDGEFFPLDDVDFALWPAGGG